MQVIEKYISARLADSFCFLGRRVLTSMGSLPVILALPLFADELDLFFFLSIFCHHGWLVLVSLLVIGGGVVGLLVVVGHPVGVGILCD